MRSIVLLISLFLSSIAAASDDRAPLLWRIEGATPSYLFGTIHVGDPRVLDLLPEVEAAFDGADALYTELAFDPKMFADLLPKMFLPKGETLQDYIAAELYERLREVVDAKGGSIGMFRRMHVWAVYLNIQSLDMDTSTALDLELYADAVDMGLEVGGLETVDEQIGVFAGFSLEDQVRLLEQTIGSLEEAVSEGRSDGDALLEIYLAGRDDELLQLIEEPDDPLAAELMTKLLDHRNVNMAERIERFVEGDPDKSFFFAVGAAHMPGEMGVVKLLRDRGLSVTRIGAPTPRDEDLSSRLSLETVVESDGSRISRGSFTVFEDRVAGAGRTLDLEIVVLHARADVPRPDPMFLLAGGPGVNAAANASGRRGDPLRHERDLVFVSQRGTGGNHSLRFRLPGNDENLQGYLEPIFDVPAFEAAVAELSERADLTKYSTPIAMDDLDEVRRALGYEKINLSGGSYGTRAALVYLRRHGENVRCAILNGVAPLMFKNPLYHAWSAQQGLERIFEEIDADKVRSGVYARLRARFARTLERLEEKPARVIIEHPATGRPTEVTLTRAAFVEGLRTLMYYDGTNRQVPRLLRAAALGDLAPFAEAAVNRNRGIRNILSFGMLMSVTSAEDVARIAEHEIAPLTDGTFLGDARVRQQMAVASFWPKSELPSGFGEPVRSSVPTLILSGTHDPVTPPDMGAEVAKNFSRGLHLVLPGTHGVGGPALRRVILEFLDEASVDDLQLEPLKEMRMQRIALPRSY